MLSLNALSLLHVPPRVWRPDLAAPLRAVAERALLVAGGGEVEERAGRAHQVGRHN